jgi:mannose/cellobiose epimerase-like protein (N-acyl-D-glucosamine 2-epimerase family)
MFFKSLKAREVFITMPKKALFVLVVGIFYAVGVNAAADGQSEPLCEDEFYRKNSSLWVKASLNSVEFFKRHGWDNEKHVFYSELDAKGNRVSDRIFTVSLSRLIYALTWTSRYDSENIEYAKKSAAYQLKHMLGSDSHGPYFLSYAASPDADDTGTLDIWQQAYGLNGLTQLYGRTHNPELLQEIHRLHNAFVERFYDPGGKGFVTTYARDKGPLVDKKTIQSLIYPVSAYLANLWRVDVEHRANYEPLLSEALNIALDKPIWNESSGWINAVFDRQWRVCGQEPEVESPGCFTVSPGHNFQFSWFLLRAAKEWAFIASERRSRALQKGRSILRRTLAQPVWDKSVPGSFFSEVNPISGDILDDRKTWWQHSEAIIAFTFAGREFRQPLEKTASYYFKSFPDFENGNEWFYISSGGEADAESLKGSQGKSSYHLTEAVRYLLQGTKGDCGLSTAASSIPFVE